MPPTTYPRLAEGPLREMLADSPAVLVHGPRQCGKTTLAHIGDQCAHPTQAGGFTGWPARYDGEISAGFGDGLYAVPLRALWEDV